MSKIIKMTPEILAECRRDFEEALKLAKIADGKLNFTKTFTSGNEKATVYFTATAYTKMVSLIKNWDKEIAWHGVAYRDEDESKNNYYITDIIVYPQEVTGATVNTDQEAYQTWLYGLDDEQFNNLRMQGHSHVNMGVSPSSVDTTHQERILEQLEDDMFYIFMIWNKSFNVFTKIYDLKKNILFETGDVNVKLDDGGLDLDAFMENAKELVKEKSYITQLYKPDKTSGGTSSTPVQASAPSTPGIKNDSKSKDKNKEKKKTKAYDQYGVFSCASDEDDDKYYGYGKDFYSDPFAYYDGYNRGQSSYGRSYN